MAHFVFYSGYAYPIPNGHVPDGTEYTLLWTQSYAAINGDGGGTWAPSAFITVGGSGLQLAGTGHELMASARLTVQPGAEIRLPNTASTSTIPVLRVNGAGGDIKLYVKGAESFLDVESGANARILSGGVLDLLGTVTLKGSGGPGSFTAESTTTSTWQSGSTLSVAGLLTVGGTASLMNVVTYGTSSVVTLTGGTNWSGTVAGDVTRTGMRTASGTGARTRRRPYASLPNADADVTVEEDSYRVPQTLIASVTYTIRHTGGVVPLAGERIHVHRTGTTTPSATYSAHFAREDSTVVFTFYAQRQGFAEFEFDGTNWQLVAGAQYASSTQSGYYDDVW